MQSDHIGISVLTKETTEIESYTVGVLYIYNVGDEYIYAQKNKFHNQNMLILYVYWERYWIRVYFKIIEWINYVRKSIVVEIWVYTSLYRLKFWYLSGRNIATKNKTVENQMSFSNWIVDYRNTILVVVGM